MAVVAHLGDRRSSLRFQVKGALWASIEIHQDVMLRNITAAGALLEATLSREMTSIRNGTLSLQRCGLDIAAQVRHIMPMTDSPAEDRHLVGVEFIMVTTADRLAIAAFLETLASPGAISTAD